MLSNTNLYRDVMVTLVMSVFHKEPTSEDFMMTSSGALILKRPLNYTLVQSYNFTVIAKVSNTFTPNYQHTQYDLQERIINK